MQVVGEETLQLENSVGRVLLCIGRAGRIQLYLVLVSSVFLLTGKGCGEIALSNHFNKQSLEVLLKKTINYILYETDVLIKCTESRSKQT